MEEAAKFSDAFEQWNDADLASMIDSNKAGPVTANNGSSTSKDQLFQLWLAQGFVLRTSAAGWKLFCDRMSISPFGLWQYLPGFERLQRDLKTVEGTPDRPGPVFTATGMLRWLNSVRPAGAPEKTYIDVMTAARIADALDRGFRSRIEWWGGG